METFINLRRFFDAFKNLTFWQRIFSWHTVRSLSYAAIEDLVQLGEEVKGYQQEIENMRRERDLLTQERNSFLQQLTDAKTSLIKFESSVQRVDQEMKRIAGENQELQRKILLTEQKDEHRRREHDQSLQRFATLQAAVEREKAEIRVRQLRELEEKNERMKETWKRHEEIVENAIKSICERHFIEYGESVPFKGKPDNVIRICDELIVFDAKSPASDDLSNFNTYIRTQAEALSKYASHDSVRKDIYLVVPSNTIDILKKTTYALGNYNVFVVTVDALEPVIVSLKKLEEYEFAEQLSPEDRQSICRVLGSYIYMTKRRIQVDQHFNSHALEVLSRTNREIPEVMQEEISKHEKAMKLNPPADRRSKAISLDTLSRTQAAQEGQARAFEVVEEKFGLVING
jgi:hypothetical protein